MPVKCSVNVLCTVAQFAVSLTAKESWGMHFSRYRLVLTIHRRLQGEDRGSINECKKPYASSVLHLLVSTQDLAKSGESAARPQWPVRNL